MLGLNLNELKNYKDEILKAEIGVVLFNMGKTHIGFWHKKEGENYWTSHFNITDEYKFNKDFKNKFGYSPFGDYRKYYQSHQDMGKSPFEYELEQSNLKDFVFSQKVKFPFTIVNNNIKELEWSAFFKGDAIEKNSNGNEFITKIFFRGCENINSGIDKGAPKEQLKGTLWLSNAFGAFKKNIELQDFDDARICFYNKLHKFLSCKNYFTNPDWQEIRRFIFEEVKNWYSRLLSDSRFPINDVTLWDQAYMTATMFKAVLSQLYMDSSKLNSYINAPSSIKWRILGIQYDKLALAEKGYKPQQIQWYREVSKDLDEEVKRLLEYEYPIGNEIYRDETGIYFLVGEDLGDDLKGDSNLAKLKNELKEIEEKIIDIFKEKSFDEFYPAIFLTKASRGLMNLSYLLEKAKENFLKANLSKKERDIIIEKPESGGAIGVCQICKQRLVFKSDRRDENQNICDICYEKKTKGRVDEWLKDTYKETIWIDELKDKNNRIALVTMKFEMEEWLSGIFLNTFVINNTNWTDCFAKMKNTLKAIQNIKKEGGDDLQKYKDKINKSDDKNANSEQKKNKKLVEFMQKIDKYLNGSSLTLQQKFDIDYENEKWGEKKSDDITNLVKNNKKFENFISLFDFDIFNALAKDAYNGCKNNNESLNDFLRQIFFGSIIGTKWENFVELSCLAKHIDWQKQTIDWVNLTDKDIEFLSTLILQFLLRKNPSPARLRRIWETTKEFFEDIKKNICNYAGIPEERRKRYCWEKVNIPDGEYRDGEAVFWANKGKVYLISYLNDLTDDKEFKLKEYPKENDIRECVKLNNSKTEYYQPYMSIIDPTPISWQFIIPAEYVPNLIDNVIKKYDECFKFVYGKLPLHIGVVIQDYKKPLYVGINASRKIRRNVENIEKLEVGKKASEIKTKINSCQKIEEILNNTHSYYSLYWGKHKKGYEFYIKPKENYRKWICDIGNINDEEEIYIKPNTFDFEFLDTNARRNDIHYFDKKNYKRTVELKENRPYEIESYWQKFKIFKEIFSDKTSASKLNNLVSLLYSKLQDIKDEDLEQISCLFSSAFFNILELNKNSEVAEGIIKIFDLDVNLKKDGAHKFLEDLRKKLKDKKNIYMFLDMFEFWHKALKEV